MLAVTPLGRDAGATSQVKILLKTKFFWLYPSTGVRRINIKIVSFVIVKR